jgi:hypothetical protein
MKEVKLLQETTCRKEYNILRKRLNTSCSFCQWHPTNWHDTENDRWYNFQFEERLGEPEQLSYHPNWKLVSKNRKQWMKKKFQKRYSNPYGDVIKSGFYTW